MSSVQVVWYWCRRLYIKGYALCLWIRHDGPWQNVVIWSAGDENKLLIQCNILISTGWIGSKLYLNVSEWTLPIPFTPLQLNLLSYIHGGGVWHTAHVKHTPAVSVHSNERDSEKREYNHAALPLVFYLSLDTLLLRWSDYISAPCTWLANSISTSNLKVNLVKKKYYQSGVIISTDQAHLGILPEEHKIALKQVKHCSFSESCHVTVSWICLVLHAYSSFLFI